MTKAENLTYVENTIANLKSEVVELQEKGARRLEIQACKMELQRHKQALACLRHPR